jgi:hypothetical protein
MPTTDHGAGKGRGARAVDQGRRTIGDRVIRPSSIDLATSSPLWRVMLEPVIAPQDARTRASDKATSSGVFAVLAAQVWEQEHQWKRERPDERGDPRPDLEAASATLGQPAGKIDRTDQADDHQCVHAVSSDAAACA